MKYILCCIDDSKYTKAICEYAIFISNNTNLPIKLLNVIEHNHNSKKINLSGNIGLGEKDDILNELVQEEAIESKTIIKQSKELLKSLKEEFKDSCKNELSISQVHGEFLENLQECKDEIEVLVLGITSHENHLVGENVKDIIKTINKPTLLVNNEFSTPKKQLIAYNGSNESKHLLQRTSKNPILGKSLNRNIVNLSEDEASAYKLLKEAKEVLNKNDIEVQTTYLEGSTPEVLLNYFEKEEYDILAMGAFGHSFIKELFMGSFTSKVLSSIKKPILLFR